MRKQFAAAITAAILAAAMSTTAFAYTPVAGWQETVLGNGIAWQYDKTGYGQFAQNEWLWIDGNNDGIAECYCFDGTGFMYSDEVTPDGYTVNADGAWTVDGVVQTQGTQAQSQVQETQAADTAAQYADNYSGSYTVPFYEMDGSVTTQTITLVYDSASNSITGTFPRVGFTGTYVYAGTDFRGFTFFELISETDKEALFFSAPGVIEWPADTATGVQSVARN